MARFEIGFVRGALLASAVALGACCERPCGPSRPPCRPSTPCVSQAPCAPRGPRAQDREECLPFHGACFVNRSENPVHVVYDFCEQSPGVGCVQHGDFRVPPRESCEVPLPQPGRVRWVRLHIGDAGYRVTRWFCCPPEACACLRRVHVDYEGYFLKGTISLVPHVEPPCTWPLGPGGEEPAFPQLPQLDCRPCLEPGSPPGPPMPPPTKKEGLKSLTFENYGPLDGTVAATFTGSEGSGDAAAFDAVTIGPLTHGKYETVKTFTLASKPADPKPTVVSVSAGGTSKTVKAKPGRFIAWVKATLVDSTLSAQAEQDDGSKPDVTP